MSFASFKGTSILSCNSQLNNSTVSSSVISTSSINTSSIDMGGLVITNEGLPVNPSDSANKAYVDSVTGDIIRVSVTLTNTLFTTISTNLSGSYIITIKNIVTNGPSAIFVISKSETSRYPSASRLTSNPGFISNERLKIIWPPNGYLQIQKDGNNYNGLYSVKILIN